MVVAGLPNCLAVINTNSQLANRFKAPVVMPRFDWANDAQRVQFAWIMSSFHAALEANFSLPDLAETEMAYRFHHASGGAIGNVARVLQSAVRQAGAEGSVKLTLETFHQAFADTVFHTSLENPFTREFCAQPDTAALAKVRDTFEGTLNASGGSATQRRRKRAA